MKRIIFTCLFYLLLVNSIDAQINFNEINAKNPDKSIKTFQDKGNMVTALAMSPNGKFVVSGSTEIKIWDLTSKEPPKSFNGHTLSITHIAYSIDGKFFATSSSDNTIMLWDGATGQYIRTIKGHSWIVNAVAISANNNYLVSCGISLEAKPELKVWDINGNFRFDLSGHEADINTVAFSPTEDRIASGSSDSTIKIWDCTNGQLIKSIKITKGVVTSLCFTSDGKYLLAGTKNKLVRRWNTSTWKNNYTVQVPSAVKMVKVTRNGQMMAVICDDFSIRVWNLQTGEYIKTLAGHKAKMSAIDFSADCKYMVSASIDGTIKLWDLTKISE